MPVAIIRWLGIVTLVAAETNHELGCSTSAAAA
jgi:hypothetical protein